ncbi:MAG TPA: ABC transporter substrate-binding protein [Actinocrinis sp.]|nr:ABC transporter substrate-binding protein [Actinocrinis sp.]
MNSRPSRSLDIRSAAPGPSRRTFLLGAGGVTAAMALAACSGHTVAATDRAAAVATGAPVQGGTLNIAFWADLEGAFDPNQVYWIETRSLNRNFADSLTDQDPATGEIVPWLAESWTVSPDASEYTFTLRQDVTFSDGTKFDAAAVKTAYDGIAALGANSTLGIIYLHGYQSSTVIDEYTVKVAFDGPNAQFLQASSTTTLAILSPDTYKKTPQERASGQVIGSGLFTLDSFTAGQSVKLTRRKDYAWPSKLVKNQGAAYLDQINVTYISEDSVRVGNLLSGDIDIAWPRLPISQADQQRITAAGDTVIKRSLPGISDILLPNVTAGRPLADPAVRQALTKAIDRAGYASTVFWTGYPVVAGPLESSTPGWKDESALLAYDKAGAQTLLDQAGWTTGPDGFRYKDGRKLTLVYLLTSNTVGAQLLQDQVKAVGIDLQLQIVTAAQEVTLEAAGSYDIVDGYYTRGDASVLASVLDLSVVKSAPGKNTQDAATAQQVSAYFAQGLATVDVTKRDAAYAELQKYVIEQGVAIPVYERLQVSALSSKLHGFAWTSEGFIRANDLWKAT